MVTLRADGGHGRRRGARRLQARREDHDGAALVILVCFIVVAIKGLLDWQTWVALGRGLVPQFRRPCRWSGAGPRAHGFTQIMAIAGQALPPAVLLSYGYLAANAGYTAADIAGVLADRQNLGVIWGLFSVVVIVAGATALHAVYTGAGPDDPGRQPLLAD